MDKIKFIKDKNWDELPKTTGVYFFYGKNVKSPIYIGKAINIKERVKNHFQQPSYRDNLFINKVNKIGYLETESEIEALILEANLIKKHQPKFNVIWKDDKNYFYVALRFAQNKQNNQKIPYITITHQPKSISNLKFQISNSEYIGPFTEGNALKKTLRFLRRVFPYYTSDKHPKVKCTYCHLDLCPGPLLFENPPSREAVEGLREYKKNIQRLISVLSGKSKIVLNSLRTEMSQFSKTNKFEEAGKIRDKIYNLQRTMAHAQVINPPIRAAQNFSTQKNFARANAVDTLAKIIGIEKINKIECYDVSNIQGKFATGSMVVFANGKFDKKQFKRFSIKIKNKPNDIAMIKEVLKRRFSHLEWNYPEVILIDGGKAHLNAAIIIKNQNKQTSAIRIISLAKGGHKMFRLRKEGKLFIENKNKPISLKKLPQETRNIILLADVQAHRFAINYHKKLLSKNLTG